MCFYVVKIDRHVGLVVYKRNKLNVFFFANNILCVLGGRYRVVPKKWIYIGIALLNIYCFIQYGYRNGGTYSMG